MIGLAIEAATEHVEILVRGAQGETLAAEVEEVGHGHTRRLTPLVALALARARVRPAELGWVAADLGPGSFTGVRVGLATAEALALASGAAVLGASSLAALALASGASGALVVPLVPAGRRDVYAGFFRADRRGTVSLLAAPRVGTTAEILAAVAEALPLLGRAAVRFVGPGAAREQALLEAAHPGSTTPGVRFGGLSADDLAHAARSGLGPRAGLPGTAEGMRPMYVRPAQAEERVRHRVTAADPVTLRPMAPTDLPAIAQVEREVFSDPWPESFFLGEITRPHVHAFVAESGGALAGYSVAWLAAGTGHLGNLAVLPGHRRRGIARRLLTHLMADATAQGCEGIALEVRVSNFAAQGLYRAHGFRLAGLRRGYYRDTGEDALVMAWHATSGSGLGDAVPDSTET
ncbi:MAG: tRNA (adenosine(37)-N6)-threonylcarbamoyltransferase complex dimerization subunit type 1 TsaB [Candidatus Eisenbacteria bacterium]|uniref:tRNA (Adenosine(37)-N6)-threonylcarbamoyltransferase complex dimerization subunit type 1 TsaB n=1 Tax=Eiseniibacteriota bacterium TaxID=2212470 RepID=A0A538U984_UNCEI|nr:MAG: tRNA (adenosine(37)-N6)-threonylcarbamoyltransferase complex dimerization subunit type 1 TsaB [Candidatus Eisenbacteria bacterium]